MSENVNGRRRRGISVKQCIVAVFVMVVVALACIIIVAGVSRREVDLAEEEYTFEYGEDALARLKSEIQADEIEVNFQEENNMGYPKVGRYTGTARREDHEETFSVLIEDTVAPQFTSSVSSLEYNVGEGSNEAVLSNFAATDVSDLVEYNIQGTVDFKTAGSYDISVSATDPSRNTATIKCTVTIIDSNVDTDGNEGAYNSIQSIADRISGEEIEYTDELPINTDSHITISNVGVNVDVISEDSSPSYFGKVFNAGDIYLYTYQMSKPGSDGSVLIGGSSIDVLSGLPSVVVGDTIVVYWDGIEYHYTVTVSEECRVDGNTLYRTDSSEEVLESGTDGVLQIFTDYHQAIENGVWFVKAQLVG